jgi:hypothetical protein
MTVTAQVTATLAALRRQQAVIDNAIVALSAVLLTEQPHPLQASISVDATGFAAAINRVNDAVDGVITALVDAPADPSPPPRAPVPKPKPKPKPKTKTTAPLDADVISRRVYRQGAGRARPTSTPTFDAPAESDPPTRVPPGTYDRKILVALRDAGELGATLTDCTRACVGPGRPQEVGKKIGSIDYALKRLIASGQVVRDGRYYKLPEKDED